MFSRFFSRRAVGTRRVTPRPRLPEPEVTLLPYERRRLIGACLGLLAVQCLWIYHEEKQWKYYLTQLREEQDHQTVSPMSASEEK